MARVTLQNVRLSFPVLFEAKAFEPGAKPRFDATFLVEPGSANDKKIKAAIDEAAKDAYGAKAAAFLKSFEGNSNKYCYLDGDLKEYDGYEGMMYLACHASARPLVIDRDKTPLTEQDGKPYAGCYVNATVDIYAQTGKYPGIRASFNGVQFASEGDAFGGGARGSLDDFEDLSDGADADDIA